MARRRKSGWEQFADSFNAVYGTFNKLGKQIESGRIMDKEYQDDEGNALTGSALDSARVADLAKVMTKYGDAEGGLAMRLMQANLRGKNNKNRFDEETHSDRADYVRLRNESVGANTDQTRQNIDFSAQLHPGVLAQQGATLASTRAGTARTQQLTSHDGQLFPLRFAQAGATLDSTLAGTARTQQVIDYNATVNPSAANAAIAANRASMAQSALETSKAMRSKREFDALSELNASVVNGGYETPEEAEAAFLSGLSDLDIDITRKGAIEQSVRNFSYERLNSEAVRFTTEVTNALKRGGTVAGLTKWDEWTDGFSEARYETVKRSDGKTVHVVVAKGPDGRDQIVLQAGSESELKAMIQANATDPVAAMNVANSTLENKAKVVYVAARQKALEELAADPVYLEADDEKRVDMVGIVNSTIAAAHPVSRAAAPITMGEVAAHQKGRHAATNRPQELPEGWTARVHSGKLGEPAAGPPAAGPPAAGPPAAGPLAVQTPRGRQGALGGGAGFKAELTRGTISRELASVREQIKTYESAKGNAARSARAKLPALRQREQELELLLRAAGPELQGN